MNPHHIYTASLPSYLWPCSSYPQCPSNPSPSRPNGDLAFFWFIPFSPLLVHPIFPSFGTTEISLSPFDISEYLPPGMLAASALRAGTFSALPFRTRGSQQQWLSRNYSVGKVFFCTAKSDKTGVPRIPVVPDGEDGAGSCPFPILLFPMWPS